MVKTGVERYDKLPGRVGLIDVDSLRAFYSIRKKQFKAIEIKLDHAVLKHKGGKKYGKLHSSERR